LGRAEVELIRRTRLLDSEEVDDLAAHRAAHPEEPVAVWVLVVGDVPAPQATRLRTILSVGGRLGMIGVIVGDAIDDVPTLVVDADRKVSSTSSGAFSRAAGAGRTVCPRGGPDHRAAGRPGCCPP